MVQIKLASLAISTLIGAAVAAIVACGPAEQEGISNRGPTTGTGAVAAGAVGNTGATGGTVLGTGATMMGTGATDPMGTGATDPVGTGGDGSGGGANGPRLSAGCGMPAAQALDEWVRYEIMTPDTPKGPYNREFYVRLPAGYDPSKPYKVIYQGPGCGGKGYNVYPLENVHGGEAIQVGLSPDPNVWQGGCFDDQAGDQSIEYAFIEAVHNAISGTFCFDQDKVFIGGYSSMSWLANMGGCVFAGDIFRAQANTTGGLPADLATCNGKPIAGFFIHDSQDTANVYQGTVDAVNRLLTVNGCTGNFDGPREPYAVEGSTRGTMICEKFSGCPAEYPIVLCTSTGQGHGDQADIAVPGYWQFFNQF